MTRTRFEAGRRFYVVGRTHQELHDSDEYAHHLEAVEFGAKMFPGEGHLIGVAYYPDVAELVPSAREIARGIHDEAKRKHGSGVPATFPWCSSFADRRLNDFLRRWAREYLPVRWRVIESVVRIEAGDTTPGEETDA